MGTTSKLTQEEFLSRCTIHSNLWDCDFSNALYKNSRTEVEVVCKSHGKFSRSPIALMLGHGCKICGSQQGKKAHLTLSEYKLIATGLHNKYDYSLITESEFNNEKITVVCHVHGKFLIRKSAHISPTQLYGCQRCSRGYSRNEEIIENWLKDNNVVYQYQKTFPTLSNGKNQSLPFDFYIPGKNLIIEFDGRHHFMPVKFGKGQSLDSQLQKFEQIKTNDGIKIEYVINNGLKMLRVGYLRAKDLIDILKLEILNITPEPIYTKNGNITTVTTKTIDPPHIISYDRDAATDFEVKIYY